MADNGKIMRDIALLFISFICCFSASAQSRTQGDYYLQGNIKYDGSSDYKSFLEGALPEGLKLEKVSLDFLKRNYWARKVFSNEEVFEIYEFSDDYIRRYMYHNANGKESLTLQYESAIAPFLTCDYVPLKSLESARSASIPSGKGYFLQPGNRFFAFRNSSSICIGEYTGEIAKYQKWKELPMKEVTDTVASDRLHLEPQEIKNKETLQFLKYHFATEEERGRMQKEWSSPLSLSPGSLWDNIKSIGSYFSRDEVKDIKGRIDACQGTFEDYKAYLEAVMPEGFHLDRCSLKYLKNHYWCSSPFHMGGILYLFVKRDGIRYIIYFPDRSCAISYSPDGGAPVYFTDNYVSSDSPAVPADMKEDGCFLQPGNLFFFNLEKGSVCIGKGYDEIRQFKAVHKLPKEVRQCLRENASSPAAQPDSLYGKPLEWWLGSDDNKFRINYRKR